MNRWHVKLVLAAVLVIFLPASVAGFELGATDETQSACASDTLVYILPVTNADGKADSFTVSLSGEASKWAVAAPAGFVLQSGESKSVYIYVTPSPKAQVGTYNLDVLVNSGLNGKQSKSVSVVVNDCHSASLIAEPATIQACACTPQEYSITLENTGRYTENFAVSLGGSGVRYATASLGEVKLAKGGSEKFKVSVNTACNAIGSFPVTVTAASKDSNAVASAQLGMDSQNCYDFDVVPDKTYLSFCENSEAKIPVEVKSAGVVDNSFALELEGPAWATLDKKNLDVPAGQSGRTNLVLFPSFGVAGDFKVRLQATGAKGGNSVAKEITANVLQCHITDLKIAAEEDTICPFTSKAYAVSLANNGRFDESYVVTSAGADFAGLDKDVARLQAGNASKFNLIVSPKDVSAGEYTINLAAESQGPSKTSSTDTLKLRVASKELCFGVQTAAAQGSVDVAYGEGALIPVVVENKGRETSTYDLEVSGSGANYAELNPGTLTLGGGQAQTVYLYIAIPIDAQQPDYKVTVGARLKDGTVSSSATVDVNVVSQQENQTITGEAVKQINKFGGTVNLGETGTLKARITDKLRYLKNLAAGKVSVSLPTLGEVKARALGDLGTLKSRIKSLSVPKVELPKPSDIEAPKLPELPKVPELKLPKFELPQQISDVRNRIAGLDDSLRNEVNAAFGMLKSRAEPALSYVRAAKAQAYDLLKQETLGYKNWMIAGGIVLVLVVLFGVTVSMPKQEGGSSEEGGKGPLGRFWGWLEEEELEGEQKPATEQKPPAEQPKPNGEQKGVFRKFLNWLEEEDEPEARQPETEGQKPQPRTEETKAAASAAKEPAAEKEKKLPERKAEKPAGEKKTKKAK